MSKLFFVLLFLTAVGAGVLWWLIQSTQGGPFSEHKQTVESKATPEHKTAQNEHAAEAPAAEHSAEANHEMATHEVEAVAAPNVLHIQSEPSEASVRIEGHEVGKTPFELSLKEEEQKVELYLAGYELFERVAPKISEAPNGANENLAWKIQLKPVMVPELKIEKPKKNKIVGDVFIQVRSLSTSENSDSVIEEETIKYLKRLKRFRVQKCLVNLEAKGEWARLIVGPYKTKAEAMHELPAVRRVSQEKEAFISVLPMCVSP